ncbi:MAG: hypothetical protein ACRC9Y_07275 [Aeromonas veronii]
MKNCPARISDWIGTDSLAASYLLKRKAMGHRNDAIALLPILTKVLAGQLTFDIEEGPSTRLANCRNINIHTNREMKADIDNYVARAGYTRKALMQEVVRHYVGMSK